MNGASDTDLKMLMLLLFISSFSQVSLIVFRGAFIHKTMVTS